MDYGLLSKNPIASPMVGPMRRKANFELASDIGKDSGPFSGPIPASSTNDLVSFARALGYNLDESTASTRP